MKTMIKILAAVGVLGALGYAFRKQITEALDAVLTKVDALIEDPTPETDPIPDGVTGYGVGKRGPEAGV
jgi:hypothetical protein